MSKIVLPALLAVALLGGCLDPCANTVVTSAPSPDGRHRAVLFERSCGATTGFSTQLSILGPGGKPKEAGNAFTADDREHKARAGAWGGPWAEARWLPNGQLLVRYAAGANAYRRESQVDGVTIRYEAVAARP